MNANTAGLTDEQVAYFRTFGYIVMKQVFTADELETIRAEFDFMLEDQYGSNSYDGSRRHWTMMMDEETPFFASMLEDPRLLTVARQLYGDDVLGVGTDANRYTGDTGWHRDTRNVNQYGVKFAFYLQPVEAETGALRVIPGTHRLPDDDVFATGVRRTNAEEVPSAPLASEPGDVVAFDLRLWHASVGGSRDRHMCTVVYYANPRTEQEMEALRVQAENNVRISIEKYGPKRRYMFSKSWMANQERSPDRQAWIDRLTELGYFDPPGVVEA